MKQTTVKKLQEQVGTLSNTSKMPAYSFGISAKKCNVGSKLAKIEGTVCHGCYALKGFYVMHSVKVAHEKRLQAMHEPYWVDAMTMLIKLRYQRLPDKKKYFRWFDSGDIQSLEHLQKIIQVCKNTPDINHWLPTREYGVLSQIKEDDLPPNLIIRASAIKIDGEPPTFWRWTSAVHTENTKYKACPALKQEGECRNCRACWDRSNPTISYEQH